MIIYTCSVLKAFLPHCFLLVGRKLAFLFCRFMAILSITEVQPISHVIRPHQPSLFHVSHPSLVTRYTDCLVMDSWCTAPQRDGEICRVGKHFISEPGVYELFLGGGVTKKVLWPVVLELFGTCLCPSCPCLVRLCRHAHFSIHFIIALD